MARSSKVDAYIAKKPEFAAAVLEKIRTAAHKASPAIEETIKWNAPCFEKNGQLASMAAFTNHVTLSFARGASMKDPESLLDRVGKSTMGSIKLGSARDLPPQRVIVAYFKEAIALNGGGTTAKRATAAVPKASTRAPADLASALKLKKHAKARATFDAFSPSNKRDYVEWLTEAKQAATRERRLKTALEWMADGKPRNWKYMKEWR